jgi:hypothetical protein
VDYFEQASTPQCLVEWIDKIDRQQTLLTKP